MAYFRSVRVNNSNVIYLPLETRHPCLGLTNLNLVWLGNLVPNLSRREFVALIPLSCWVSDSNEGSPKILGLISKDPVAWYKITLVTYYLSSSCHVAHKASTQSRQPSLSAAAICTSLQFFHPAFSISLFAVLLHVVPCSIHCSHFPIPYSNLGSWGH